MALKEMSISQPNPDTLTSLYFLRARAHNFLRLALNADDRDTQDRYLAAAREVLEQMEDTFDRMRLDTPEDAVTVLERLSGDEDYPEGPSNSSGEGLEDEGDEEDGADDAHSRNGDEGEPEKEENSEALHDRGLPGTEQQHQQHESDPVEPKEADA